MVDLIGLADSMTQVAHETGLAAEACANSQDWKNVTPPQCLRPKARYIVPCRSGSIRESALEFTRKTTAGHIKVTVRGVTGPEGAVCRGLDRYLDK